FYLEDLKAVIALVPQGAIAENGEAIRAAKKCNTEVAEVHWNGTEIENRLERDNSYRKEAAVEKLNENDIALILHSSGTTGRPKALPLTHANLCRTMANIQATYNLTIVYPPLMSGGSIIVPPRFSASEFWRDFIKHGANWYTAVPTIHQILLRNNLPSPRPKIRFIRSCSSPLSTTAYTQLETVMGTPVVEAYLMTEASHQMTSNPLPPLVRKSRSVGIPQGVKLQIMDDDGEALAQGQIREVCIQGVNVTSGYLGEGIASPFTKTEYFRTGDQGFVDKDRYLTLTGRIKELINKGGEKISPIEIDNLFAQHPKVAETVCFAIDDELYGQNVTVAVALEAGELYFTATMPKTATGKVQRRMVAKAMIENEKKIRDA
ncbi:putative peroxisomal-coenzyme A synthetase, partial [Lachnellula subtilissima]